MKYKFIDKDTNYKDKIKTGIIKLSIDYTNIIDKTLNEAKTIFREDLKCIILGGSCGKNIPVVNWSDIDLYIILDKYEIKKVKKFTEYIKNSLIHIGTTFYTEKEIKKNLIDERTKVMLYEKQKLNVNPTIYGSFKFKRIKYRAIKKNDRNNLPKALHEFRRMHIKLLDKNSIVEKKYIKKLILVLKCYFNIKGKFLYGYLNVINEFLMVYNEKENKSTKEYFFDIIDALSDVQNNKKKIIDLGNRILDFMEKEMEWL